MLSGVSLLQGIKYLIPLILSLTVHEWAHAYSAYRLGDDTAAREGRMTLNPISHIDPFGTILCPLLGIPFGWAKPVPVNPVRFNREISMRAGMMITAAAGPLSNLVLAVLCSVLAGLLGRFQVDSPALRELLYIFITINLGLFIFNFIPVPPLDGSRVAEGLMPYRLRPQWEQIQRYSWVLLLGIIYLGRSIMAVPILWCWGNLAHLIAFIAGSGY
jgi:Zn-dependent protease